MNHPANKTAAWELTGLIAAMVIVVSLPLYYFLVVKTTGDGVIPSPVQIGPTERRVSSRRGCLCGRKKGGCGPSLIFGPLPRLIFSRQLIPGQPAQAQRAVQRGINAEGPVDRDSDDHQDDED